VPQSLVPRGRADLSTVIAFVNRSIHPTPQDPSAKPKDFAWFAVRPVSGAHVRASAASICVCVILEQCEFRWRDATFPHISTAQVPFIVELMAMMVSQNKAYVLLDNQDVLGYLMPTVSAVRAMLCPEATQYADDRVVDNSSREARSLVLVILDLRVQQHLQHSQFHPEQQYQMPAQPAPPHGGWNGFGHATPSMHSSNQMPSAAHGYMPPFGPTPTQGSVLSQWTQPRQAPQPLPLPGSHPPHQPSFAEGWRGGSQPNAGWGTHSAPPHHQSGGGQGWGSRRY
jgi:hypothetical protein